jgi:hypothetical protein
MGVRHSTPSAQKGGKAPMHMIPLSQLGDAGALRIARATLKDPTYIAVDLAAPPVYIAEEGGTTAAAVQHLAELCASTEAFPARPTHHTPRQRAALGRILLFRAPQGGATVPHRAWSSVTHICDYLHEANRPLMVPPFLKACGLDKSNEYSVAQAGHPRAASQ